jgi:hypothetical protein
MISNSNQGIAIYLVLMIMAIVLAAALALSAILVSQIKIIKGLGNSVIAFYAADTGIERELYEKNPPPFSYSGSLNNSTYEVQVLTPGPGCDAENLCIKSVGSFKESKRAVEIKY